jgi:hypothetical protein
MKKQFAILFIGCTAYGAAFGATTDFWWMHDTICTINDALCYTRNTPGIDTDSDTSWDTTGNCRGRKIICAAALSSGGADAIAMSRDDIARGNGISSDFDTNVYVAAEGCYGARKTSQNGAMVLINGKYVRVWCNDVPINPSLIDNNLTDEITNGIVTTGMEPLCSDLAPDNYVATLNGNCYGKRYDPSKYSIDCDGENPVIIVLNGAQYNPDINNFITPFVLNARFGAMQTSAATQRSIHFPK